MTEQRNRKEEKLHRRKRGLAVENQRMQLAQHGETTQTRCTQTTETPRRTYTARKLIKDRGKVISVLADGHYLFEQ